VESYTRAIQIKPDFVQAHFNLGVARLYTGDRDSALREVEVLKALDAAKAVELSKLIQP
jgi:hypothetical protein